MTTATPTHFEGNPQTPRDIKRPPKGNEGLPGTPKNKLLLFPYVLPLTSKHSTPKIMTNSVKIRFLDNLSQQCNNKCNNQNKPAQAITNINQQTRGI